MSFSLTYQRKGKEKQTLVHEGLELNSTDSKELKSILNELSFCLTEEEIGFSLKIDGDGFSFAKAPLPAGTHPIPNGHEFTYQDFSFTPVVLVDRAEVSNSAKNKSILSRLLIALILAFELIVIFVLPSSLSESNTFLRELLLEHATTELDRLRADLRVNSSSESDLSTIRQAIIKQVRDELSSIASHIRNDPGKISLDELRKIKNSLIVCRKLIPRLKYGSFVDQVPSLDRQLILDRLFQED